MLEKPLDKKVLKSIINLFQQYKTPSYTDLSPLGEQYEGK
jgi:hypothetical protein